MPSSCFPSRNQICKTSDRTAAIKGYEWPAVRFWYRQRPISFVANHYWNGKFDKSRARVGFGLPAWDVPGELGLRLNPAGELRWFRAVPDEAGIPVSLVKPPTWSQWYPEESVGFDLADMNSAKWRGTPPGMADTFAAWESDQPLRVQAAAFRGRPVFFQVSRTDQNVVDLSPRNAADDVEQYRIVLGGRRLNKGQGGAAQRTSPSRCRQLETDSPKSVSRTVVL